MSARVSYHRLTPLARAEIRDAGLTVAEYVRAAGWTDGDWHGDSCGCRDDRCIGYHHDAGEDCGCLPVLINEARGWSSPGFHYPIPGSSPASAFSNGTCRGMRIAHPGTGCVQCGWDGVTLTGPASR